MKIWYVLAAALVLVALAVGLCLLRGERHAEYSLIHMPAGGRCPEGFAIARGIFVRPIDQNTGVRLRGDGCMRIGGTPLSEGGVVDRLDPGEGLEVRVPLERRQ